MITDNTPAAHVSTDNTAELNALGGGPLLDCTQAAHYLNLSESYVRKRVSANEIPYVAIGTRTLFRRSDLDEWVSERVVPTNSEIHSRAESLAATTMLRPQRTRRSVL